ncbi:MAG: hypothetical protein IKM31_11475 [Oscillospiraceae bacterium]|nr:hypothetical protein [Oscillospiraceae bacterium]
METFEEMKQRYRNDMMRYAKLARVPEPEPPSENILPPENRALAVPPVPALPDTAPGELPSRTEDDTGTASLIVRTTTAGEALPLEGTLVIISRNIGGGPTLQWMGLTDISGNTVRIPLPAPDEGRSERPGEARPYASYIIQAAKNGYYTAEFRNVPVFAGVTAVQPVEMIPLPTESGNVSQMIVVERAPDL